MECRGIADTAAADTAVDTAAVDSAVVDDVAAVVSDSDAVVSTESRMMSSMSSEFSAESSIMAEIPILDIINAGICIDAAQTHFAQGDNVRGTLDIANAIPGVNLVSAPVTMELDFAQAGGQIINDSANCGILAVDYEMGNVDATDIHLDRCWGYMDDQVKQDVMAARRDQGWEF